MHILPIWKLHALVEGNITHALTIFVVIIEKTLLLHNRCEARIIHTCTNLATHIETIFTMTSSWTIDDRTVAVKTLTFPCKLKSGRIFITSSWIFLNYLIMLCIPNSFSKNLRKKKMLFIKKTVDNCVRDVQLTALKLIKVVLWNGKNLKSNAKGRLENSRKSLKRSQSNV